MQRVFGRSLRALNYHLPLWSMLDTSDACRVGNTTAVKVPVVTAMFLHEVCLLCDEIIRGQEFPVKIPIALELAIFVHA